MINKKWEKKKIEDIFKETYEKNQPNSDVLTIIQGRGTVLREASGREIIYDKNSLSNYKHVQKNDFIIHLRSFEGGLEIANQDGIVSPAYITLHPKIKIEPGYLYALFHSNQFINQTMAPAVEGARDGRSVKYEVLKKQSIAFPPLPEQRKIAEILTAQDRVIALKEKLVAEKRKQKKFLMQRLLSTDDTRPFKLNGVTIEKGKWEKKKIEDIFKETCEKNQSNSDVLTIIQGRGTVLREDSGREIIYDKNGLSNYKHVQKNDFIIHLRSFEGGLEIANQDGIVSPAYITLHPKIKIEPGYLYALFHSNQFINQTMAPAVEGARDGRSVKYEVLKKQSIVFPPLPEQQAIAEVLSAADREISLREQDLEQERQKKKSLMQLLLSGLVRVNAPEDSHEL